MTTNSRETKVIVILGASITLGAVILNILGHNPPSAGAFCLSRYYRLGSVKKAILSRAAQSPGRWSRVKIYFSGTARLSSPKTESGNTVTCGSDRRIESAYGGLSDAGSPEHINPVREQNEKVSNVVNCHFVICNGNGGRDGQIQATEKWQRQSPISALVPAAGETTTDQTIYICVIADGEAVSATDFQIKRTDALVEELSRKFNIQPESIRYPDDWQ